MIVEREMRKELERRGLSIAQITEVMHFNMTFQSLTCSKLPVQEVYEMYRRYQGDVIRAANSYKTKNRES
jgi:hypothetical protein